MNVDTTRWIRYNYKHLFIKLKLPSPAVLSTPYSSSHVALNDLIKLSAFTHVKRKSERTWHTTASRLHSRCRINFIPENRLSCNFYNINVIKFYPYRYALLLSKAWKKISVFTVAVTKWHRHGNFIFWIFSKIISKIPQKLNFLWKRNWHENLLPWMSIKISSSQVFPKDGRKS